MQGAAMAKISISHQPEIRRTGAPWLAPPSRSFAGSAEVAHVYGVAVDPDYLMASEDRRALTGFMAKLDAMRQLEDGWNSYSAPRPSERSIGSAKSFVQTMWQHDYPPRRIAPSAAGGVAVSRRSGNRHVYVEFFNDGRIFALFSDDVADPDSREIRPTYGDFLDLIREMKAYLDE